MPTKPKSGYTGVRWNQRMSVYEVYITHNGSTEYLGSRANIKDAVRLYDLKAIQYGKATNLLKPHKKSA